MCVRGEGGGQDTKARWKNINNNLEQWYCFISEVTNLFGFEVLAALLAFEDILGGKVEVTASLPEEGLLSLDPGILAQQQCKMLAVALGVLLPLLQLVLELACLQAGCLRFLQQLVLGAVKLLDFSRAFVQLRRLGCRFRLR